MALPQAAKLMGCSSETLRRRIRAGTVEYQTVERPQGLRYLVRVPETLPGMEESVSPAQLEVAVLRAEKRSLEARLAAQERFAELAVGELGRQLQAKDVELARMGELSGRLAEMNRLLLAERSGVVETTGTSQAEQVVEHVAGGPSEVITTPQAPAHTTSQRPWWHFWRS